VPKTKNGVSKTKSKPNNKKKPTKTTKKGDFETKLKELNDKHLRLKAEYENFRRRKSEEISRLLQFDGEDIIKGFLPIIDDLERMMNTEYSDNDTLLEGINLVRTKIDKFFENINVETFGDKGEEMDPMIHDAMLTQENKEFENDVILEVFEKGYTYRDKVIRHAKVIVNKV